ncbi:hypothetical protein BKH46_08555 [Helicobacter sp. 12S02634-8]|uniref:hypothetical protein n=1 Tax=Helicobacter sp. 12S02634-8 TaxID=1476199 RepID=UPI000BA65D76|nr:hypothetical protein [Helicobacter sp. 12S02634-8]PAF46178.1 hypothetical protein BKH46_08555 [Helicobacter sp. 12S02634-8]
MNIRADLNALAEEYFCSERALIQMIFVAIKDAYPEYKILYFDMEKQYIYAEKNGRSVCFKASRERFSIIKKSLINALKVHRKEVLSRKNFKLLRGLYHSRFCNKIVRTHIVSLGEKHIEMAVKDREMLALKVRLFVSIDDFFDTDLIAVGHNFNVFIQSIRIEKDRQIILKGVRKNDVIVEKEIESLFAYIEKKSGKKIDFNVAKVDLNRALVVLNVYEKYADSILGKVAEAIKKRVGFSLFWTKKERIDDGKIRKAQ